MIRGYEPAHLLPVEERGRIQIWPALCAGFLAGFVLLIVPRGTPWSALTFFSPEVMGRALPMNWGLPLLVVWVIHLAVSLIYGVIISLAVAHLMRERAILAGAAIGVGLYLLNLGVVSLFFAELKRGVEGGVLLTHIVFGLFAAGAYRGLLKRRTAAVSSSSD